MTLRQAQAKPFDKLRVNPFDRLRAGPFGRDIWLSGSSVLSDSPPKGSVKALRVKLSLSKLDKFSYTMYNRNIRT